MLERKLLSGLVLGLFVGCVGTIEAPEISSDARNSRGDEPNTVDTDGDGVPDSPAQGDGDQAGDGDGDPSGDGDGDPSGDGDGDPSGDGDGAGGPTTFTYATLGTRCSGGTRQRFVVISRTAGSCESHARALDEASTTDVLRVAVGDGSSFSGNVSLCDGAGCRDVNVNLSLGSGDTSAELDASLGGDDDLDQTVALTACDYDAAVPPSADALAANIAIRELAVYQGVKITLAQNGQEVGRNAPVVEGRPGLLRVFVEPQGGFTSRPIVARLTLDNGGTLETLSQTLTVSGASSDQSLGSTLNFDLSGAQLRAGTQYSVSLHEEGVCGGGVSENSPARFPASGLSQLGAEITGSPFRVVLVPVRYNGDGSGRLPNVGAEAVQGYRDLLYSMFPAAELEVTVRAQPMDFNGGIFSNGDGWSQLLDQCLAQRAADDVDPRTYYYCMFNPASSFGAYCGGGCVAGLGPVPGARDVGRRGSIGLGFGDAGGTMAHEVGHSLGRPHAPCGGVAGPDPGYPYNGGTIGAWGYDMRDRSLIAPNATDFMGYCGNTWISDYNYELIFNRFQAVLNSASRVGEPLSLTSIVVGANGQLSAGHTQSLPMMPEGEAVRVRYLDASGGELGSADGSFMAVTHVSGGIVYVPTPPAGTASVSLEGFGELAL
jgi:hypothetical protein